MPKVTTEEYSRIVHSVLSLPRKNRDMVIRALTAKADVEDAEKAAKKAEKVTP